MEYHDEKQTKNSKKTNFNEHIPDSIKEKLYVTRRVDTSISILECQESDVILEALLFLSKYADVKVGNLTYLQQQGIAIRILNLLDKNICILRVALRLLGVLLHNTPIINELDQDIYDSKIVEISNLYTKHTDRHVKEFCVDILSILAESCRITCLIFNVDLFKPILETIRTSQNPNLLTSTLILLERLLISPAATVNLLDSPHFDIQNIPIHLFNVDYTVAEKAYHIVIMLTSKNISSFQRKFKERHLVEKMLEVVTIPDKKIFHNYALEIVQNCLHSEETNTYFVKTVEFLTFCQWVKTCDVEYLLPCINIFEELSSVHSIIQLLYDFSVEESILYFLRCQDKNVLNKACKAIMNMTVHKYCCEDMLTPVVIISLVNILNRTEDVLDPTNEVALETVYSFFVRTTRAIDMLYQNNIISILINYLKKLSSISESSCLKVIEMLYRYAMITEYQDNVLSETFFEKLFDFLKGEADDLAELSGEILAHFVGNKTFNLVFLSISGPKAILNKLKNTSKRDIIKFCLLIIHNSMFFKELCEEFLLNGLISVLKGLSPIILAEAPIIDTIITLAYNVHLPLKFNEKGKLDLTNKLCNKFYIIREKTNSFFPFLEVIDAQRLCPLSTIYLVDYSYEVVKKSEITNPLLHPSGDVSSRRLTNLKEIEESILFGTDVCQIPNDPYLPHYINHVKTYCQERYSLREKITFLARYIDEILCGPVEDGSEPEKIHIFETHLQSLKYKLSTSVIPVGYLRLGFHCERALLFKAIADKVEIPCTIERKNKIYWNEVGLLEQGEHGCVLTFYVVDLMTDIGSLLLVGSRIANKYLKYIS